MRRTAKYNEACRIFDQKNDAEIVNEIQRQTGRKLKSLDPDAFNKVRVRLTIHDLEDDKLEGNGFRFGDRVTVSEAALVNVSLAGGKLDGIVEGVRGSLLRVNGRYYDHRQWVKA